MLQSSFLKAALSLGPAPHPRRAERTPLGEILTERHSSSDQVNKVKNPGALAGWLRWSEHRPVHQKVAGSVPGPQSLVREGMGGN